MNKRFLWYSLLVALPAVLLSCDHRLDPSPLGQFRLRSVSYNARTVNGVAQQSRGYQFAYDAKGLLSTYTFSFTQPNGLFFNEYQIRRDAQDRPIEVLPFGRTDFSGEFLTYEYSGGNRVSQVRTLFRTTDPANSNQYVNQLIRRYGYVYTTPNGLLPVTRGYLESQLSINNAQEEYTFVNGNAVTINGTTYNYDDKPNAYYGLLGFNAFRPFSENPQLNRPPDTPFDNSDFFADIQVKLFNKNNILNNVSQIDYNADGLVTRIVYANGNMEEFTYEPKP